MHTRFNYEVISRRRYLGFTMATAVAIAGVAIAGSLAYSSTQKPKESSFTAPEAPSLDDAKAKSTEALTKKRRAIARNQTTYTGPLGLSNQDQSNLTQKTMLGQ